MTSRDKYRSPTSAKQDATAAESTSVFSTVNAIDGGHQSTLEGSVAFLSHRSWHTRRRK
jgi:hypothetical protein